ncbi:MAG: AAA family ATPase [Planctomycetia bacterium]|nr:AAA family ATPase [Planctomycetia bacterium]
MLDQLKLFVRSGYSLLAVTTRDEQRAVDVVRRVAEGLSLLLFEWSITSGLVQMRPSQVATTVGPGNPTLALAHVLENRYPNAIYVFKDLAAHSRDPFVQRQLRDISELHNPTVVLINADQLPEPLRRLAVPLALRLPDTAELEQVVRDTFREVRNQSLREVTSGLTKRGLDQLVQSLRGLTRSDAARVVAAAIHQDDSLSDADLPLVVETKRNLLQAAGCLESVAVNVGSDEMGGLDNLKSWLTMRRGGLTAKARAYGLDPPRGMLLLGVQGCGKSLCAKIVAAEWHMPLLRMDPGVLYQKFIGESENRLREALAQAEAMAPVVLWIDEIEKAFASAGVESADGGLSQRMFGTLLSWMQEHPAPIFMVATANNIAALPPELMRKGRFDEVFFVDLPGPAARRQILEIHLRRRHRDPAQFALDDLVAATEGFSGAELEQLIVTAMYSAFSAGVELADEHLRTQAHATQPLSVLMRERVVQLRAWAHGRCVPAD